MGRWPLTPPPAQASLIKAGHDVELFDRIHERLREEMPTASPRVAERLARRVWCGLCLSRRMDQSVTVMFRLSFGRRGPRWQKAVASLPQSRA